MFCKIIQKQKLNLEYRCCVLSIELNSTCFAFNQILIKRLSQEKKSGSPFWKHWLHGKASQSVKTMHEPTTKTKMPPPLNRQKRHPGSPKEQLKNTNAVLRSLIANCIILTYILRLFTTQFR